MLYQFWKDQAWHRFKDARIAEKTGHMDENLLAQGSDFSRVLIQVRGVCRELVDLHYRHAANDPPLQGSGSICQKIHLGSTPQQQTNPQKGLLLSWSKLRRFQGEGRNEGWVLAEGDQ